MKFSKLQSSTHEPTKWQQHRIKRFGEDFMAEWCVIQNREATRRNSMAERATVAFPVFNAPIKEPLSEVFPFHEATSRGCISAITIAPSLTVYYTSDREFIVALLSERRATRNALNLLARAYFTRYRVYRGSFRLQIYSCPRILLISPFVPYLRCLPALFSDIPCHISSLHCPAIRIHLITRYPESNLKKKKQIHSRFGNSVAFSVSDSVKSLARLPREC